MQYIGVDLAWSQNNDSGIALLEDNKLISCDLMRGIDNIAYFINQYPNALIGVDAPLKVENETGNRDIEKEFLKDFAKYKLGVYPVNKKLLSKYGPIAGVELGSKIDQKLGSKLYEVYPHATILQLFHGKVLPYKRKKGRDTSFIKEQLEILQNYILNVIEGDFTVDISKLKGAQIKEHEDKLDAIICAYTVYYCHTNNCKTYGDIFKVPMS
jgi:predicted RNase H-like nuclease